MATRSETRAAARPAVGVRAERRLVATHLTSRHRLPQATAAGWEWQLHAHCRGMDPAIFFPSTRDKPHRARANDEARAKQICQHCPVLRRCRSHALDTAEPHGIWGGLTPLDRALHLAHHTPPPPLPADTAA